MKRAHDMPFGAQVIDADAERAFACGHRARSRWSSACTMHPPRLMPRGRGRLVRNDRRWHAPARAITIASTTSCNVPDPASRYNPGRRARRQRGGRSARVSTGATSAGRVARGKKRSSTSCTSAPSRRRARSPASSSAWTILRDLGVTAIELMPLADFPGRRNWGYDGVLPFAPDAATAARSDLKRLVRAAHERGLMMLLDVVYNHFGPEGNYLQALRASRSSPSAITRRGVRRSTSTAPHSRAGARLLHPQRALLARGVSLRRPALRRGARDRRRLARALSSSELARALRDGPGQRRHVHLVLENDAQPGALSGARRRATALLRRAVERRRASRAARAAHRRARRLLRGLCRRIR